MSIRLSSEEAWAELAAAHTGILTTLRVDGVPIALPVWFVILDQRIYVGTPSHTKKVARVRRDERVAFLVESGTHWSELRGVHVTGRGRIVEDPEVVEAARRAMAEKYKGFRTPRSEMPADTRRHYDVALAVIEITPDDRILSWDNARLAEGR